MSYTIEIKRLASLALSELNDALTQKKIPTNPISEEGFLCRWVATASKKQRFLPCVNEDLKRWTQQGRSMGKNANLKAQLTEINQFYTRVFTQDDEHPAITKNQFDQFVLSLKDADWMIHTEFDIDRKVRVISDGQDSFAVCNTAFTQAFDETDTLTKPLSLYFRGHEPWFVAKAFEHQLLLKKITHYKSIVKYHGEYQIWPNNQMNALCVIPKIENS